MTLPDSVATATVEATFIDAAGNPRSGTVKFTPTTRVTVGSTGITVEPVTGYLTDGVLSVTLAATDDADLQPTGWGYSIVVNADSERYAFIAFLPAADSPINLFSLTPVAPVDPLLPDVKSVNDVFPDEDGNVDLGAISAPVTSVAGRIGAVVLAKADVGLGSVDNTTDLAKPLSTASVTALAGKSATGHAHIESDVTGLVADLATKATVPKIRQAYIVSGNIQLNVGTNTWGPLSGGPTLAIPAVVGDWIELDASILRQANANVLLDIGVVVGGSVVRYLQTGTSTPPSEGDTGLYTVALPNRSGLRGFVAVSGDISGGNVTFCVAIRNTSGASSLLLASAANPFQWIARNLGVVNTS
jgi:hypothetical protein